MSTYSLSHVSDPVLLRDLAALVARDRATTAALLAHLAEVDARRLYLPAAHPSMFSYCVEELHLSEDAASKRIQAARAARQFPALLSALAEGRLHLAAVCLLAPHLTPHNADELIRAATGKRKAEIEVMLAERFPRSEMLPLVQALPTPVPQHAPGHVESNGPGEPQHAPGHVEPPAPRARVAPISAQRYALQLTVGQGTHDKLRHAQALLGHQVSSGDLAQVLDRALDALIRELERRKFAATTRPRCRPRRSSANPRHIPASVKRAVWERDGGQCTFESKTGRRCPARARLEFDHMDPVARGGEAAVDRMRLRCRAHNQYDAECTFGAGFMSEKREAAQAAAAGKRAAEEVIPWLRGLGFNAEEARRAAVRCDAIPAAPLEERLRVALSCFAKAPESGFGRRASPEGSAS